ncbi:toprim domain-containing protein [Candidatus Vidania fulgoroideorum]
MKKLIICKFHKDNNESLLINDNGFFYCFGCKKRGYLISNNKIMYIFYKNINFESFNYLLSRKINNFFIIREFGIGYCNEELSKKISFLEKNFFLKKKLIREDRFIINKRITFPIRDEKGIITSIISRNIRYCTKNKYIFCKIKNICKSNLLYGFYENYKFIKRKKEVFIVEGCMDLISMLCNGIRNVVSTLGNNLSKYQINMLNFCNRIIIMFDNDIAGRRAVLDLFKKNYYFNNKIYVLFTKFKDMNDFFIKKNKIDFINELKNIEKINIFVAKNFFEDNFVLKKILNNFEYYKIKANLKFLLKKYKIFVNKKRKKIKFSIIKKKMFLNSYKKYKLIKFLKKILLFLSKYKINNLEYIKYLNLFLLINDRKNI